MGLVAIASLFIGLNGAWFVSHLPSHNQPRSSVGTQTTSQSAKSKNDKFYSELGKQLFRDVKEAEEHDHPMEGQDDVHPLSRDKPAQFTPTPASVPTRVPPG